MRRHERAVRVAEGVGRQLAQRTRLEVGRRDQRARGEHLAPRGRRAQRLAKPLERDAARHLAELGDVVGAARVRERARGGRPRDGESRERRRPNEPRVAHREAAAPAAAPHCRLL